MVRAMIATLFVSAVCVTAAVHPTEKPEAPTDGKHSLPNTPNAAAGEAHATVEATPEIDIDCSVIADAPEFDEEYIDLGDSSSAGCAGEAYFCCANDFCETSSTPITNCCARGGDRHGQVYAGCLEYNPLFPDGYFCSSDDCSNVSVCHCGLVLYCI